MLKALRGTKDVLPGEIEVWQEIEAKARRLFSIYGYKEIRTPIIEESILFTRSIGDWTDIVQKEMYVFSDRGDRNIALRPEATAGVVRAYIENYKGQLGSLNKFFYIGPMFRAERPQQGRQRQFHQIGVEAIGSDNALLDAEVISLSVRLLEGWGVKKFKIALNSLGCQKDKIELINSYRESIKPYLEKLCEGCKTRFDKNVLRIFDCKEEKCREIVKDIHRGAGLCGDCSKHFDEVKKGLDALGVKYIIDSKIVRGLDYYTKTVFEITQEDLGAKDAICAGGRYNNLVKDLGGEDTPAIGFAFGIERIELALKEVTSNRLEVSGIEVFIARTGTALYGEAFKLLDSLRNIGISSEIDYDAKSLKSQMRKAQKLGAKFVVIFGEEEFKRGKVILRDMKASSQKEVGLNEVVQQVESRKLDA